MSHVTQANGDKLVIDRNRFDELLRRRFYVAQSFEIYGGVAGLYDYGPSGSALKNNLINLWRKHFVYHDSMFELDCTCLTPKVVLEYFFNLFFFISLFFSFFLFLFNLHL